MTETIIITLLLIELGLYLLLKKIKKVFQWILFPDDIYPKFEKKKFNYYLQNSYSKKFGWVRKSNLTGYDKLDNKKIKFVIDKKGYRNLINKSKKVKIASYGGSFVFGRQVKDDETWQEHLTRNKNFNILNFGIGNYGTDQAILRYQYSKLSKSTNKVILGIVPEHICRIQSEWKHFFEFGNIHGFKPKFYLKNNKIFLKENPLNKNTKLGQINKIIDKCMITDRFYKEKFKKNILRFPYILYFMKNLSFNIKIVYLYIFFRKNRNIKDLFLKEVMKRNIILAHKYYNEYYSKALFIGLIKYFTKIAKKRNQKPYLIIFPQKLDILEKRTNKYYIKFFKNQVSKELKTLDLTNYFYKKNIDNLFTNKIYGGHLNSKGNKFVSKIINKFLDKNEK